MIELLIIGATLTIAAWASGSRVHQRNAASRALDRYAQSRGLLFVPAPSAPRGASPRVLGSKDGAAFVVDLYRLGGEIRTRVVSVIERGRPSTLSVCQRGAFAWKEEAIVEIGEPVFDQTFVIQAGTAEDAEGLREARAALLVLGERARGVWLACDGWKISLSWRGMESDPVVLDAARDAVALVAGWHRPGSAYR